MKEKTLNVELRHQFFNCYFFLTHKWVPVVSGSPATDIGTWSWKMQSSRRRLLCCSNLTWRKVGGARWIRPRSLLFLTQFLRHLGNNNTKVAMFTCPDRSLHKARERYFRPAWLSKGLLCFHATTDLRIVSWTHSLSDCRPLLSIGSTLWRGSECFPFLTQSKEEIFQLGSRLSLFLTGEDCKIFLLNTK